MAESIAIVRELIASRATGARVEYGGSAQSGTFTDIAAAAGTATQGVPDGLFIARFCVDADNFLSIVREVREITAKRVARLAIQVHTCPLGWPGSRWVSDDDPRRTHPRRTGS